MSEQAARTWLSSHGDVIPALDIYHQQALATLKDQSKSVGDLADIIAFDPGMSVSLFQQVNGQLKQSGKHIVESVQSALSLLGEDSIAGLVREHKRLDETTASPSLRQAYHQLMSRSLHLLAQLDQFISNQGMQPNSELACAGLLHNIGEYCACLFDSETYQQCLQTRHANSDGGDNTESVFGFEFDELGRVYAQESLLPSLVTESLDNDLTTGRKARLIQLAADVSLQAEQGWYQVSMTATSEACANYLNQPPDEINRQLHQVAIAAARLCPFDDVFPAAARLILEPDREMPAPPTPAVGEQPSPEAASAVKDPQAADGQEFDQRVKSMLKSRPRSKSKLFELLLCHLHDDLNLSRVALMLVSPDQNKIGPRASKGIDPESPIQSLVINIGNANLFKSLLSKTQSIWIAPDNYRKFEAALPTKFKSIFATENFFLMSIHLGDKPVGIIFADAPELDKVLYLKFKSATLLTAKALTLLTRPKQTV